MGILSGNPQNEPLHYGEVFDIWNALLTMQGAIAGYQVYINHTGDEDLKRFLENLIENDMNSEIEALLKVNGVALPPALQNDQLHLLKIFLQGHVLTMRKLRLLFQQG